MTTEEIKQRLNDLLSRGMSDFSGMFSELQAQLSSEKISAEAGKQLSALFKQWLKISREISAETRNVIKTIEDSEKACRNLREEKRRLEVLYTSGIVFASQTEMHSLMEKAISIIVRELDADAGFIVLCDATGKPTHTISRNIDPGEDESAREMSTSVIRDAVSKNKTIQLHKSSGKSDSSIDLLKAHSIIRLGINSVLCVPLILDKTVLGAVYIDRRAHSEKSFCEADLTFLLSFARQIVNGIRISREIDTLEQRLLDEAVENIDDLRKKFECDNIVGNSRKLFEVLKVAAKIAPTPASVVLLGENGTGKELLAHAIHENSRRAEGPFVAINCSAIPKDLLESELFGYESGAFTGATKSKPGKFELADGGTIFLDEIGDMSINLQAKLLRVLQTREIERLGGVKPQKIDVRVICATNRNLKQLISDGQFREDLYYRLKVVQLTMPALRDRKEDIEALTGYFLTRHAAEDQQMDISPEAMMILEEYDWPGNIRELENVILRGIVLAGGHTIEADDLPEELHRHTEEKPMVDVGSTLSEAEAEFRRMYILRTMRETGSKAEAAKKLGINRTHFYRILSQLNIDA